MVMAIKKLVQALGFAAAVFAAVAIWAVLDREPPAQAFGEYAYVATLGLVASDYCPHDTMEAKGQTLDLSEYSVLYALLGTTYGGDGYTTFALPDLREHAPLEGMRYCIVIDGTWPPRP